MFSANLVVQSTAKYYQRLYKKGEHIVMTERKKQRYEGAALEILLLKAEDVIATSSVFDENNTDYVDSNGNSWVIPGIGGWN